MPLIKVKVRQGLDVSANDGSVLPSGSAKDRYIQTEYITGLTPYETTGSDIVYSDPSSVIKQRIITNESNAAISASANA